MALGTYRTKTYIAAVWDDDNDAIDKLHEWNNSKYLNLSFFDVHNVTQSRDSSLNCSIKRSLKERMDISKTFILIVGEKTNSVMSGSCGYCPNYRNYRCTHNYPVDFRSYIEFECDKALEAYKEGNMKIVVLYNNLSVNKNKCPEALRYIGRHIPMIHYSNGRYAWDYVSIKNAIEN